MEGALNLEKVMDNNNFGFLDSKSLHMKGNLSSRTNDGLSCDGNMNT